MRKQLRVFNSSVDILRQYNYESFSPLTWEDASDVSSAIYTINIPNEDDVPLCIKRSAIDAHTLIARCCEEIKYLESEMSNALADYFNQCLEFESRLSLLSSRGDFEHSNFLQGLYSIIAHQLYDERVQLFAACDMFKKYVTPSLEVTDYIVKHTGEINVIDYYSADEEVASDEDDDNDIDDD